MIKKKLTNAALLAVISTGLTATALTPVVAAELQHQAAEKTAEQKQADQNFIKVSEDAQMTMRNVGGARLALFNGSPDKAQIYADAAVTRAAATLKEADKFAVDTKASKKDGQKYVPFDSGLTIAETLKPGKEKPERNTMANRHPHEGVTKKDIESLKVEGVDVAVTADLLPIQKARTQIEEAAKLIGEGKYYEANLALKSVEDSVIIEVLDANAMQKNKASS